MFNFRRGVPKQLKSIDLEKGEFSYLQNVDNISIMKYRDKKVIYLIFSNCSPDVVVSGKGNKEKPLVVDLYNKFMGSVDQIDQQVNNYSQVRKTVSWAKKTLIRLFELCQVSARGLWSRYSGLPEGRADDSVRAFMYELSDEWTGFSKILERERSQKLEMRNNSCHQPVKSENRRVCRVCLVESGEKKKSVYFCASCESLPALCPECFIPFHSEKSHKYLQKRNRTPKKLVEQNKKLRLSFPYILWLLCVVLLFF